MNEFENPLQNLKIASPCSQDWNAMAGDDRRRYCGECKLNVYNLSGMTRREAEKLVRESEGRLCVRFYRRADGSVLTADCPVGLARVRQRARAYVTALASMIFTFLGAIGVVALFGREKEPTLMGTIAVATPTPKPKATPKATPEGGPAVMGGIRWVDPNDGPETIGEVAVPERPVKPVKIKKRRN